MPLSPALPGLSLELQYIFFICAIHSYLSMQTTQKQTQYCAFRVPSHAFQILWADVFWNLELLILYTNKKVKYKKYLYI